MYEDSVKIVLRKWIKVSIVANIMLDNTTVVEQMTF